LATYLVTSGARLLNKPDAKVVGDKS